LKDENKVIGRNTPSPSTVARARRPLS
jgi:hypothetical protein